MFIASQHRADAARSSARYVSQGSKALKSPDSRNQDRLCTCFMTFHFLVRFLCCQIVHERARVRVARVYWPGGGGVCVPVRVSVLKYTTLTHPVTACVWTVWCACVRACVHGARMRARTFARVLHPRRFPGAWELFFLRSTMPPHPFLRYHDTLFLYQCTRPCLCHHTVLLSAVP